MVTDQQVRKLMKMIQATTTLDEAAMRAGMSPGTARKYRDLKQLPSESTPPHDWRTRPDPFAEDWGEIEALLKENPGLQAKTIFGELCRRYPGKYPEGQLRTLQRRMKAWRAISGPAREVFFPQDHFPGELCQSDFTDMTSLGITIQGQLFRHLFYHLVLTWSNWETGSICFSESFESLSHGFQKALWEMGGVPRVHQTDRLSAAINNMSNLAEFTERYQQLLRHYRITGRRGNPGRGNENGDVEQRHYRFKEAVDQSLMLRQSRDFKSQADYEGFLRDLLQQLNSCRRGKFQEELLRLQPLPHEKLPDYSTLDVSVGNSSTIRVLKNTYSVHSRLIGEQVTVKVFPELLEVWYAQTRIDQFPRLRGEGHARINYRHIIDWLVRKPGAFEHYRYREELFPTSRFRRAFDHLKETGPSQATKEYLQLLEMAAKGSEEKVDSALESILAAGQTPDASVVKALVETMTGILPRTEVVVGEISLADYDVLLSLEEVA